MVAADRVQLLQHTWLVDKRTRVRCPRCTPLSEREPAGPRQPSVDGPGLNASVTTPEPVVTPTPIRSRPTAAVAAAAAPRDRVASGDHVVGHNHAGRDGRHVPGVTRLDQKVAASSGARIWGKNPQASARGTGEAPSSPSSSRRPRRTMRSIEPLPPRLPLPTILPTRCVRCPWNLPDGFTRSWIQRGAGAATEPPISVRRPGPERNRADQRERTAVDTRSTSRTQSAESMRWVVTTNEEKQRTDTGGAARLKIAGHELGAPFHDQNTRGRSEKQSGDPAQTRRVPPLPDYPPGLSGTMGSTSPDAAAETAAVRRHPSGQARAATAQSTAAPAPPPPRSP